MAGVIEWFRIKICSFAINLKQAIAYQGRGLLAGPSPLAMIFASGCSRLLKSSSASTCDSVVRCSTCEDSCLRGSPADRPLVVQFTRCEEGLVQPPNTATLLVQTAQIGSARPDKPSCRTSGNNKHDPKAMNPKQKARRGSGEEGSWSTLPVMTRQTLSAR